MRTLLLAFVVAACAPRHGPALQQPFAQYAGVRAPPTPAFNPATDAYNPNVAGPRPSNEPVFALPWRQSKSSTEQEREAERQRYVSWYRTQLMSDPEWYVEHHLFPCALRAEFQQIGIDVDEFTILVDPAKHQQAHSDAGFYGPGGMWNWEWKQWFKAQRGKADRLTAWAKAFAMIDQFALAPHGPLCPYRCGREVVHDQFDRPDPSPKVQPKK